MCFYIKYYFKFLVTSDIIAFFTSSKDILSIVAPAAFICPPPPKIEATSETFTYSFDLRDILYPFSFSYKNIETSTSSIVLPISTIPSLSPGLSPIYSSSFLVRYVKAIFPSAKNSNLFIASFSASNLVFVIVSIDS